jgi:hypothetical protein
MRKTAHNFPLCFLICRLLFWPRGLAEGRPFSLPARILLSNSRSWQSHSLPDYILTLSYWKPCDSLRRSSGRQVTQTIHSWDSFTQTFE